MSHSFKSIYFHCVWSTAGRVPLITSQVKMRLYPYIVGIIQKHNCVLVEIGGMPDHIHLILQTSNLDDFTNCMRDVKSCSSGWLHHQFPDLAKFKWQRGTGVFSISYSMVKKVREYIQNQQQHHEKFSFEHEFLRLLQCHDIEYDERFIFA